MKSKSKAFKIHKTGEPRVFRIFGELDLATAGSLAAALQPELDTVGDLILDLSELTFMDSSGIKVLIKATSKLEGKGSLILRSAGESIRRVLTLTQLDRISNLTIVDQ
ncbi:MAG: STAS domain-containing protein [Actinomycetota bacterium]